MPEPVKTEPTPNPEAARDAALAEGIAKGLAKELGPILSRPASEPRQEGAPLPPPPPLPKEPSYDDIMDAIEAGDKRKAADLMSQRDRAREARLDREVIAPLREQGTAAISSMARESGTALLSKLPAKFHAEVKQLIKDSIESKGAMATVDHWRKAIAMVYGEHADEIEAEKKEVWLRQSREKPEGLEPGQGGNGDNEEHESETLAEEFGKWAPFKRKLDAKRGAWSSEQEVQALNRGIKGAQLRDANGKIVRDYKEGDFLKERRETQRYAEENPHLGLDE